jgi:hypothetical protein
MAGASGDSVGISLYTDTKGRTYIKGVHETRRALMAMGMERNLFEKWIKQSAIIAAREAVKLAPVGSDKLAMSIRGGASKKYTSHGATKRAYGGVVLGRTDYARAVSYGHYYRGSVPARSAKDGTTRRVWRKTHRTPGNPFMVKGRENAKPAIVHYWRNVINTWTKQKGFETHGF